jgi:hypothetical protein
LVNDYWAKHDQAKTDVEFLRVTKIIRELVTAPDVAKALPNLLQKYPKPESKYYEGQY